MKFTELIKYILKKYSIYFEFIFNGLYCLFFLLQTQRVSFLDSLKVYFPQNLLNEVVLVGAKLVPFVILVTLIGNIIRELKVEVLFRKYIFTLIVLPALFIAYGDIEFAFWLGAVHLFSTLLSVYDHILFNKKDIKAKSKFSFAFIRRLKLKATQVILLSFLLIIFIGALLLALPISTLAGKDLSFVDAIFTATSATCVTGLMTVPMDSHFSIIGKVIILILIQIGGLGIMTLSTSMTLLLGKTLEMKEQVMMRDVLDISSMDELILVIIDIIKFTFIIEFIGALFLSYGFMNEGLEFGQALFYGFFHSISAFCNAGFALFSNSLENYSDNYLINITVSILIVCGGLGFIVLRDLKLLFTRQKKIINLTVHTKIVVITNIVLILIGFLYLFFSEFLNSLEPYEIGEKIALSFFHSITTRTAGFNALPMSGFYTHSLYLMILMMFIGASPGSTGGGIKTTTFAILFRSVTATLRGKDKVEFFDRRLSESIIVRSIAIIVISLIVVSLYVLVMIKIEPEHTFLSILFEVVSAFSTVGLSLGITPYLSVFGKLVITSLMFIGRVGPLTMVMAIGEKQNTSGKIDYPEGKVVIG